MVEQPDLIVPKKKNSTMAIVMLLIFGGLMILTGVLGTVLSMLVSPKLVYSMIPVTVAYDQKNGTESHVGVIAAYRNYDGVEIEYERDVFDCRNFSDYFLDYADESGFGCHAVTGCPKNRTKDCHRWVRCDIEPQTFTFVNYNDIYPDQRVWPYE